MDAAPLEVIQIRPQFYVIAGGGSNVAVQLGPNGVVVVDTGTVDRADQIVAEIRKLSNLSRTYLEASVEQSVILPQVVGLIVIWILMIWIPVAVHRSQDASRKWKWWVRVSWFPLFGFLFLYPAFLATLVWKGTAGTMSAPRRRIWRTVACVPLVNLVVMPFFLRTERFDVSGTKIPMDRLRAVTAFCSVVIVAEMCLVLMGRPTSVPVGAERRISGSFDGYVRRERQFLSGNDATRPELCVALSGGGIRSAAFSLGVLRGLHDLRVLRNVDVISAVSGGTYALSWLMLQPFYGQSGGDEHLAAMFSHEGRFQNHLRVNSSFVDRAASGGWALFDMTVGQIFRPMIRLISEEDMGTGTRKLYAWRIQNTFHGHPGEAGEKGAILNALAMTPAVESLPTSLWVVRNVEFATDLRDFLRAIRADGRSALPYPVFNLSLRADVASVHRGQIWPYHLELTPLGLGGPALGYVEWDAVRGDRFRALRSVNIAPAISGAAISSYAQVGESWQRTTIRLLNVDLGYEVPNFSGTDPRWIYVSDGGHAENLGLYALLRRHCGTIIAVDAEHEAHATEATPRYEFSSYHTLVKAMQLEQVAELMLKVGDPATGFDAGQPVLDGEIMYADGVRAPLVYIKLALDRPGPADLPAPVSRYATTAHPRFPHDPTSNQEYEPEQFRAYEGLGRYIACNAEALRRLSSARCADDR